MISVIIPLYNKENSILDTVNSVLNQTFTDFELIIVNDGSIDKSLSIVQSIKDDRVKIINKINGGVSSARNIGIINAKSEYLAFIDGDDIWSNIHLEILFDTIRKNDSDIIGGAGTSFYKSNSKVFDNNKFKKYSPEVINDYYEFMSSSKPRFNSSTLMVKKSKVLKTGLFNEKIKYGEDVEFWYKLFSEYKIIYNQTITTIYFVGAENRSVHNLIPLDKRFHEFNYEKKSISEKKYLDKLVALILIDYINQKAYKQCFVIMRMYPTRILGILNYVLELIKNKFR